MIASTLLTDIGTTVARWAKLVPALLRHDPLFRYATIAAAFALFFLAARLMQDMAGPSAIPPAGRNIPGDPAATERVDENEDAPGGGSPSHEEPPVPGSATTLPGQEDASPHAITPSRPLESIEVTPAPRDSFGTVPQGETRK